MPAFHECRVIKLIIIKKETPTAGFKTSKRTTTGRARAATSILVPRGRAPFVLPLKTKYKLYALRIDQGTVDKIL